MADDTCRSEMLKPLRAREDLADIHAMAGDFRGACNILREVNQGLAAIYGRHDPYELRQCARADLGHWA
jgi:hypothetical protein